MDGGTPGCVFMPDPKQLKDSRDHCGQATALGSSCFGLAEVELEVPAPVRPRALTLCKSTEAPLNHSGPRG